MTSPSPVLQDLAECADKLLVGMKAVNLGRLIRGGFPVPGGFVITTNGYRFGRTNGGDGSTTTPDKVHRELVDSIVAAYRSLGSPPVAVRSSATAEDMVGASMAGQYDTFLDITTEAALIDAVQCCWASVDSPRTRSYFAEHGIDVAQVAMAVIVQRLVAADVAGVLFTANPKTGVRGEMLVEASWGLGEAVVSGRVQPDVLRIDRATGRVIDASIADKQIYIPPGEHEDRPVAEARRRIPCLGSPGCDGPLAACRPAPPTTLPRRRIWNGPFTTASCFYYRRDRSPRLRKPKPANGNCMTSGSNCVTNCRAATARGSSTISVKRSHIPRRSPGASSAASCQEQADSGNVSRGRVYAFPEGLHRRVSAPDRRSDLHGPGPHHRRCSWNIIRFDMTRGRCG